MDIISASEARAMLPAVLDRVQAGAEVTITRHGHPVAVVVRPDRLRLRRSDALDASARAVRTAIEDARSAPVPITGLSTDRADEVVAQVRAGRSAR